LKPSEILQLFSQHPQVQRLAEGLPADQMRFNAAGIKGSARAFVLAALFGKLKRNFIAIISDKEKAAYFLNDLESILEEQDLPFHKKAVLFYPTSRSP